jgi:tRNA(Ile)-lysidine synthase
LLTRRLNLCVAPGESLEAAARRARYASLAAMAHEAATDLVLLAHHRRDQAETVLLQALRGGGMAGWAAMPSVVARDGLLWARPWLGRPREAIEAYVAAHELPFVEDDSNTDTRFARNRLRSDVWPALSAAFPHAEHALADAAARLSVDLAPTREWQQALLAAAQLREDALDVTVLSRLPEALRRTVLASWLRGRSQERRMTATWVERLAREVPALHARGEPARWPEVGSSLYRGELRWSAAPCALDALNGARACATRGPHVLTIAAPGDIDVPGWPEGVLRVKVVATGGVAPERLQGVCVRARSGGEQFQAGARRPARALKKQFQAAACPPWMRDGPLLFAGDALLFVPGLGEDARVMALAGEPQWGLSWCLRRADAADSPTVAGSG